VYERRVDERLSRTDSLISTCMRAMGILDRLSQGGYDGSLMHLHSHPGLNEIPKFFATEKLRLLFELR